MNRKPATFPRRSAALLLGAVVLSLSAVAWPQTAEKNVRPKPGPKPAPNVAETPEPRPDDKDADTGLAANLQRYDSKSYHVFHNLSNDEAKRFAAHMDAVYEEYASRFASLSTARPKPMPLYLFRKQTEYEAFMASIEITAKNTGGMFFVTHKHQGLATFVGDRPITQTFAVLQHEGFHQFAFRYIGPDLPVWINEGLAQYFEDGVLVGNKTGPPTMYLGLANATRIASVQQALEKNNQFDFDALINISNEEWAKNVTEGNREATLEYDQSWSIAFFLIAADNGKYRPAFEKYLKLVSQRRPSDPDARTRANAAAFTEAFGTKDTAAFKQRWTEFARAVKPDLITLSVAKLEFLGQGLRYLSKQKPPMPNSIAELRDRLQRIQFRAYSVRNGVRTAFDSKDESFYSFDTGGAGGENTAPFKMLKPENPRLPPRIAAIGIKPEPTLVWYIDGAGELTMDVAFTN
jgi:hypothetical protein